MTKKIFFIYSFLVFHISFSQSYPPAAGLEGSTAIPFDSPEIVAWATGAEIIRGYINIKDTNAVYDGSNRASFGTSADAIGPASGNTTDHVVSLGDSGIAILTFARPITNGNGFDFAVFENGVTDDFLELAHVEVSSDGIHFVRFPSHSLTPTDAPVGSFGSIQATHIHHLAGKYRVGFGTSFDVEVLKDSANLDITKITHVKIIDVVGSLDEKGTSDSFENKINDPFPTPFHSGGFDLAGVGVLHELNDLGTEHQTLDFSVYPNPGKGEITVQTNGIYFDKIIILNQLGQKVMEFEQHKNPVIKINLSPGIYTLKATAKSNVFLKRLIVQ